MPNQRDRPRRPASCSCIQNRVFVARPWQLAAAAPCTHKAKDGVVFRENRDITYRFSTSGLPGYGQAHKTASAALDAWEFPAPQPPPDR
jgi:hypothetical protein